jgi:hypothetical protein
MAEADQFAVDASVAPAGDRPGFNITQARIVSGRAVGAARQHLWGAVMAAVGVGLRLVSQTRQRPDGWLAAGSPEILG